MKLSFFLFLTACTFISCSDQNESPVVGDAKLIQGHWNDYENGTEQTGFTPGITTSLTIAYESGIAFYADGTFRTRYHNNGTWTESNASIGTYALNEKTITLLFSPRTTDEYRLDIQLVKLDEKQVWIKHSLFVETEYHLERVTN